MKTVEFLSDLISITGPTSVLIFTCLLLEKQMEAQLDMLICHKKLTVNIYTNSTL